MKITKKISLNNFYILILILILMITFFSIFAEKFFSFYNIISMMNNLSFIGIVALPLTIVMITGELDFSIGGVIGLTSSLCAFLYDSGLNIWLVIILGLLCGLVVGAFNGFFVSVVKVNSLILTLGTMYITRGIAFTMTKSRSILIIDPVFNFIGQAKIYYIPFPLIIFVIVSIILIIIMKYSKFGRSVYATGSNLRATYLSGINVYRVKFISFILCATSAALAGIILASMSQVGMPQHGLGLELPIISAVVLGGTALAGGKGQVSATILGVLIISILYTGLAMMNILYYRIQIAQGLVLILVVSAYAYRRQST